MSTVVNNPGTPVVHDTNNGSNGFLFGVLLVVILAVLFIIYGLPYIRSATAPTAPQIQVPGKVDVNIHTPGK